MIRNLQTDAIVLRRTNYGEADRILRVLTPAHGALSLIARGVRREKSKLAGAIELFAVTSLTIHSGKGELGIITGARLHTFFAQIMTDYDRMQFGYQALKASAKASDAIDDPAFFELLLATLQALDKKTIALELIEASFHMRLSYLLGTGLNLETDTSGKKLTSDTTYRFDIGDMSLYQHEAGEVGADHIKLLRLMQLNTISAIAKIKQLQDLLPVVVRMARIVSE